MALKQPYPMRNYAVGESLVTLRNRVKLTQAELAAQIGIHRRTVQKWESGETYPTVENLRALLAALLRLGAFTPGQESAEAAELWQQVSASAPQPLPFFDTTWFTQLLAEQQLSVATVPTRPVAPRVDWGLAQDVPALYGRSTELTTLTGWVLTEQCRLVMLLGLGGIGKTSLAITLAKLLTPYFDALLFRSLGDAPPLTDLLDQLIHHLDREQQVIPTLIAEKLALLLELLRQERVLLILDNLETLLQAGTTDTPYLSGYEEYGRLFKVLAETAHQSCVILTSRERLHELASLEGPHTPVRSLRLLGLAEDACRTLLTDYNLLGTAGDAALLAHHYGGNPLALKLVADPIRALFGGDMAAFLTEGSLFFNGVGHLLTQQISRASVLEQELLTWLAIVREPVTLDQLMQNLLGGASRAVVLAALHSLWRRNLIESGQTQLLFTLQPVVLEFLTERLIEQAGNEILQGTFDYLLRYSLVQATAKDFVRRSQERLIATPLLERLVVAIGDREALARQLQSLLESWRHSADSDTQTRPALKQGYRPGNVVNLLHLLRGHLRHLNLAGLTLRQLYLQGVEMQDASLVGAKIQESVFAESFDALSAIAISHQGQSWAAGSRHGEVLVWATGGYTRQRAWKAHADLVGAIDFSPDGRTLVTSGSWDGTFKLWDVASGALLWLGNHPSYTNIVAFAPDGDMLASSGNDATIRLWDSYNGTQLQVLNHPAPMSAVAWSPVRLPVAHAEARLLASADATGCVRLWQVHNGEPAICLQTFIGHTSYVEGLAFSPDGLTLASASWDGTVKLWDTSAVLSADVASDTLLQTLSGHTERVISVTWSPDGRTLASAGGDHTIRLWDHEQGEYRGVLRAHTGGVKGLAFTPDSRSLLSGSEDGTLRVWDIKSRQCMRVIQGYAAALCDIDWSPDCANLVSAGSDALVTIFDRQPEAQGGTLPNILSGHTGVVIGIGWSPTGRHIASSEWNNIIRLWDPTSGACRQVLQHPDDTDNFFDSLAWSPDGQRLACGTYSQGVFVWDLTAGYQQWADQKVSAWIRHVTWSPDGNQLAGGGADGSVYLWDSVTGALLHRLTGHHSTTTRLAWNSAGTQLASGSSGQAGGELFVWDVKRGERLHSITCQLGMVYAVAWAPGDSPSEERLVSGGDDGKLRWWNVARGECVRVVEAHRRAVQSLRRSPDGTKLASCGNGGAIMLWDLRSGEHLQTLRRDRPYERMNISGLTGISEAQRSALLALGAVET